MPSPKTAAKTGLETPNKKKLYEVTANDLPLHCPMPGSSLWDSHPQVYIPVEEEGHANCPYCGAEYVLKQP